VNALIWLTGGRLLGFRVAPVDELARAVAEGYDELTRQPGFGRPRRPRQVRASSGELIEALRGRGPELIEGPCPDVDEAFARHASALAAAAWRTYLTPGVDPAVVARFFRAAAALYRAKPWKVVPSDTDVLALDAPAFRAAPAGAPSLEWRGAVVSVLGHGGSSFGCLVFESFERYEAYLDAAEAHAAGDPDATVGRLTALDFSDAEDVPPELMSEIRERGWELASPRAVPALVRVEDEVLTHPPSTEDYALFAALAEALTELVAEPPRVASAFRSGAPHSVRRSVETGDGGRELTLLAPHPALGS
jgi:hypothetical protein